MEEGPFEHLLFACSDPDEPEAIEITVDSDIEGTTRKVMFFIYLLLA